MRLIDVHAHLGRWPSCPSRAVTLESVEMMMKKYGIEKTVVSSVLGITYHMKRGNAKLNSALRRYPDIYGLVSVNCNYAQDSANEIRKYLKSPRFVGVKIHPTATQRNLDKDLDQDIMDAILDFSVPITIHTFEEQISPNITLATEYPDVNFIFLHCGASEWRRTIMLTRNCDNIYLEYSMSWVRECGRLERIVEAVGSERVVFGSDSPLMDPGYQIGILEEAEISGRERENIAYRNALSLFRFK